jgi:hypothetical protein
MKKLFIYFSLLFLTTSLSLAQVKQAQEKIGGTYFDICNGMSKTADGGFIMTGWSDSYGQGGGDVYVIKLDSNAEIAWTKTIGGTQNDGGNFVIQTADGGYAIDAWTHSFGSGSSSSNWWDYNAYVIKLNSTGSPEWTESISDTGWSQPACLVQANDNGLVVLSSVQTMPGDTSQIGITKLDAVGNIKWNTNIGGPGDNEPGFLTKTNDGGYAVVGSTSSFGAGNYDVYVIKLDSMGNVQWTETIGGPGTDYGDCIIQTADGGYAITGSTYSYGDGVKGNVYVIKLNSGGSIQWTKTIGGTGGDYGYQIIQTKDKGYAIAGQTYSYGNNTDGDLYAIKLDSLGTLQWTRAIGGTGTEYANCIMQTKDGGYALGGGANTNTNGKAYFVKMDAMGNTCTPSDSGGVVGSGGSITSVDSGRINHGVKITSKNEGVLSSGGSQTDLCAVYASVDNVKTTTSSVQVYPNPGNGKFTIQWSAVSGQWSVEVYNILGEKVYSSNYALTTNHYSLDLSSCPSGVYFYRVIANIGNIIGEGKLVIAK